MNTQTFDDVLDYSPADYQDAGQSIIPLPGNYRVKVTAASRKKQFQSEDEKVDIDAKGQEWPVIDIQRVDIIEPTEEASSLTVFQEVKTRPFARKGPGGTRVGASRAADLLRAIDVELAESATSFENVVELLEEELQNGAIFTVGTGLKATDSEWAKEQIDRLPSTLDDDERRTAVNEIWNKAILKTKDFKNANGSYRLQAQGPSGRTLDAKLVLSSFIPSNKDVELGQYKR